MTKQLRTFLAVGLLGLTFTAGGALAQAQPLINCADSAFASQPECLGRGKTGPQVQGNPSAVTPAARTGSATTATGSVAGQNMINCADAANASQPACLGRGKTGPKMEGNPSAITPEARTNKVPGG
jgi:hypothetical protein